MEKEKELAMILVLFHDLSTRKAQEKAAWYIRNKTPEEIDKMIENPSDFETEEKEAERRKSMRKILKKAKWTK